MEAAIVTFRKQRRIYGERGRERKAKGIYKWVPSSLLPSIAYVYLVAVKKEYKNTVYRPERASENSMEPTGTASSIDISISDSE